MKNIGINLVMMAMVALLFFPISPAMAAGSMVAAIPDQCTLLIDDSRLVLPAYAIEGDNYCKLRDLAQALTGTKKQFDVG